MNKIQNMEVIRLNVVNGRLEATVSWQDADDIRDINQGYTHATVPVNIRELQLSARDNVLVNQSIRGEEGVAAGPQ